MHQLFLQFPLTIGDANISLRIEAAEMKVFHKLSYAAALAKDKEAVLVTCDKEFKTVAKLVPIQWI
jgi:predicted nucleic acid-binding protein